MAARILAALFAWTSQAVVLDLGQQAELATGVRGDSKPGTPVILTWDGPFPYKEHHAEREAWGDRLIFAAATADVEEKCGGFVTFGDFTWCAKVMPREGALARENRKIHGMFFPSGYDDTTNEAGDRFLGMSYGIRERDLWAEFLSNRYEVPTTLYDCFWRESRGPMDTKQNFSAAALQAKAPSFKYTSRELKAGECPDWRDGVCFQAAYEPKPVCVSAEPATVSTRDGRTLDFETLHSGLASRPPLSTFLKIDVEGSEWDILEQLLNSTEDVSKIRSLDMEVHLNMYREGLANVGAERMERKVRTMERLAETFAVVGSTIGELFKHEKYTLSKMIKQDPGALAPEPMAAYSTHGFSLDQYCISLVNRALL